MIYRLIISAFSIFALFACWEECDNPLPVNQYTTRFVVETESGVPLIGEYGRLFDSDLTNLVFSYGYKQEGVFENGKFGFPLHTDQPIVLDSLFKDTVFIELPLVNNDSVGFIRYDVDTIHYKYILDEYTCPDIFYDWIQVGYNGKHMYEGGYTPSKLVVLKKKI